MYLASHIVKSVFFQITTPKEAFRKTWSAKYTLRSHFDGVRALAFHPTEPVLITASEDQTLKLWNLQKTVPAKKSAALDVEPVYTFRYLTSVAIVIQKGLGVSTVLILKPWDQSNYLLLASVSRHFVCLSGYQDPLVWTETHTDTETPVYFALRW